MSSSSTASVAARLPEGPAPSSVPEDNVTSRELTAPFILDVLEACLHSRESEWLFLRELRVGTGHRNSAAQRLDAFALNCLPHLAMKRVCYEIKVSRTDFLSELKHPLKRRIGMRYSNEFYFVTPAGLLDVCEIPVDCGLIEVKTDLSPEEKSCSEPGKPPFYFDEKRRAYCTVKVAAPWRDTPGPTWQFAAAMLRNQRKALEERPAAPPPKQVRFNFS